MHKERFLVERIIEDTVEVLLKPDATEKQITEAARKQIADNFRQPLRCATCGHEWRGRVKREEIE